MKSIVALFFLMFAGCASAPARYTLNTAPQSCTDFCHDYALGLVDLGAAGQAGPVFDIAENHFKDTSRPDIPKKDWERAAMRVEFALGRAATARVVGGDFHKPLIAAVEAFSELLEMNSPEVWNWIALDFLRDADILRFDREWDAITVDPGVRFVLRQFLLVQREASPDLLLIKERANSVNGVNQLVALAYILSNSGNSRTLIAQEVNERLFHELKRADVATQQVVLEMDFTANFVYWATPAYQDSVRWIIQKATELEVRGYFMPVTAFADVSERCEVIKPYYLTLLARVRNDLEALDQLMGCVMRWGGDVEILTRMTQIGPEDERTVDWRLVLTGRHPGHRELGGKGKAWTRLLNGLPLKFETPQINGLPWEELYQLRHARTSLEFESALERFSVFPRWYFLLAHYSLAKAPERNPQVLNALSDIVAGDLWKVMLGGPFNQHGDCRGVFAAVFFEARQHGIRSAYRFLNLAPNCASSQSGIREKFVTPDHHAVLAPLGRFRNCSDEKLKSKNPKSGSVVRCDVLNHRVKTRARELETTDSRADRATSVRALIALGQIAEARRVFNTYDHVTLGDFSMDQLLRVHENKGIDIAGIRFVSLWGESYAQQEIVPVLWATGRHEDACEVLTALTTVRPWITHPGKVDCPATNAAYKELWGFDPPWTLPQDEVLDFLRQAPETK